MEYINRIRVGSSSPLLKTNIGTINNAIYDGVGFYDNEEPTPAPLYTEVTEVKMTNPGNQTLATNPVFFNTGVVVPNDQKIYCEAVFTHYATNYGCNFGLNDHVSGMPGRFYRVFTPYGQLYWDYYNSRSSSSTYPSVGTTYDIHFGYDKSTSRGFLDWATHGGSFTRKFSNINFGYYNWPSNGNKFLVCITAIGIRNCQLYTNSSKGTLLFDGIAVLDNNNIPCMYDKVSDQFLYLENPASTSQYGTITYIE